MVGRRQDLVVLPLLIHNMWISGARPRGSRATPPEAKLGGACGWLVTCRGRFAFEQAKKERDMSSLPSREDEQALVERAKRDLAIGGASLEDVASQRDELRRIWAVVETLPKPQRIAMVLKFQEDMKIEDIAA